MNKYISVAIDGPAGAGKSTMAKRVAKDLGYVYVDTGAIYRTIGYHVALHGIGPKDVDGVTRLIDDVNIEIAYGEDGTQRMILNGTDVTGELRTPQMSDYASKISVMKVVRDFLLDVQRDMAKKHTSVCLYPIPCRTNRLTRTPSATVPAGILRCSAVQTDL